MNDYDDPLEIVIPDAEPVPFWTTRRIIYAIIAIIIIIAFLTLTLWPTLLAITQPQTPTPLPSTPLPRVSLNFA